MTAAGMRKLVKKFTAQYGQEFRWEHFAMVDNGFGKLIPDDESGPVALAARVLLLSEQFSPEKYGEGAAGLTVTFAKYVMALPDVDLMENDVITDVNDMKWKCGAFSPIDVAGGLVARQAPLSRSDL
jgi:hypothetical protein